jgi:hypothetical protein
MDPCAGFLQGVADEATTQLVGFIGGVVTEWEDASDVTGALRSLGPADLRRPGPVEAGALEP